MSSCHISILSFISLLLAARATISWALVDSRVHKREEQIVNAELQTMVGRETSSPVSPEYRVYYYCPQNIDGKDELRDH